MAVVAGNTVSEIEALRRRFADMAAAAERRVQEAVDPLLLGHDGNGTDGSATKWGLPTTEQASLTLWQMVQVMSRVAASHAQRSAAMLSRMQHRQDELTPARAAPVTRSCDVRSLPLVPSLSPSATAARASSRRPLAVAAAEPRKHQNTSVATLALSGSGRPWAPHPNAENIAPVRALVAEVDTLRNDGIGFRNRCVKTGPMSNVVQLRRQHQKQQHQQQQPSRRRHLKQHSVSSIGPHYVSRPPRKHWR